MKSFDKRLDDEKKDKREVYACVESDFFKACDELHVTPSTLEKWRDEYRAKHQIIESPIRTQIINTPGNNNSEKCLRMAVKYFAEYIKDSEARHKENLAIKEARIQQLEEQVNQIEREKAVSDMEALDCGEVELKKLSQFIDVAELQTTGG